jgi:hypothetical protein
MYSCKKTIFYYEDNVEMTTCRMLRTDKTH